MEKEVDWKEVCIKSLQDIIHLLMYQARSAADYVYKNYEDIPEETRKYIRGIPRFLDEEVIQYTINNVGPLLQDHPKCANCVHKEYCAEVQLGFSASSTEFLARGSEGLKKFIEKHRKKHPEKCVVSTIPGHDGYLYATCLCCDKQAKIPEFRPNKIF